MLISEGIMSKKITKIAGMFLLLALLASSAFSRTSPDMTKRKDFSQSFTAADPPAYCIVDHRVGRLVLAVKNNGTFGQFDRADTQDCMTGDELLPCEFPKNSRSRYLFAGAFWIGAVVGRDTLVSTGADGWSPAGEEFNPDISPFGDLIYRSTRFPDVPELYTDAISEEDYIAVYADTLTEGVDADVSGRAHKPLNIEVTQRSFAWSYSYAQDFVLFDYEIKNIGFSKIRDCYMGIYVDADVHAQSDASGVGAQDDICGFIETIPVKFQKCDFIDTVNIAWIADNDGDPGQDGNYTQASLRNVTATRIVRTPADSLDVSFNWWVSNGTPELDFGPRERGGVGRWKEDFRTFRTSTLGTPQGDNDKYYQLRNQEFDYDQAYTSTINASDSLWSDPPSQDLALDLSDGYDTRYLLSFGPFNIDPGEKLPISFAYIGGVDLHSDPDHFENTLQIGNPTAYYSGLNFDSLTNNAQWASRVYDNPGVDTDGDEYFGKAWICNLDSVYVDETGSYEYTKADTLFYEGDGVPDFRGASPPPAPTFWLKPEAYKVKVRWNGVLSENTIDVFSRAVDFEGYRVYKGLDNRASSYALMTSFDVEDYNKYIYYEDKLPAAGFILDGIPYTRGQLDTLYGNMDGTFDPLAYTRNSPFVKPGFADSVFYFEKQDYNASEFGVTTPITKIYPDAPYPSSIIPDSAEADELTDDGYLKYFEYEYEIPDLLPSIRYFVNVTAFDYGSPESGLPSLESSLSLNSQSFYAIDNYDVVQEKNLKVSTYPNPYRIDANYYDYGYEGLGNLDDPRDRIRRINFINLPPKCEIKIFTLDGDLVREITHDRDVSDPEATIDSWDLITRNTQLAVAGIYYYTIEAEGLETQIGKIVLIM